MPAQKIVGRLMFYIGPDGALVLAISGRCMIFNPDETRELFDYLLENARYFQASNGHVVDTEPLRRQSRMEREDFK